MGNYICFCLSNDNTEKESKILKNDFNSIVEDYNKRKVVTYIYIDSLDDLWNRENVSYNSKSQRNSDDHSDISLASLISLWDKFAIHKFG